VSRVIVNAVAAIGAKRRWVGLVGPGAQSSPDQLPNNRMPTYRLSWARLLKRVFRHDVLVCPSCGGDRQIVAAILDRGVIVRILNHLRLPTDEYSVTPARAPPQTEMWDEFPG